MIKWLRKSASLILFALTLYVLPHQQAMASTAADSAHAMSVIGSIMEKPYDATDLAHKSLVRLFGGFIFKPFGGAPGDPPTVLAKVLGYTNIIAMILGVVIMAYVILAGALNTAASGEMLGRSWSSVWLPLRTSLAFGMIVPATNGGEVFSVAQSMVIWMIIIGSNSASWLWKEGTTAIVTGSPVFSTRNFHDTKTSDPVVNSIVCAGIRSSLIQKRDTAEPQAGYVTNGVTNHFFKYSELGGLNLSKATAIYLSDCGVIVLPTSNATLLGTSLDAAVTPELPGATVSANTDVTQWETRLQRTFDTSSRAHFPAFLSKAKAFADAFVTSGVTGKSYEASTSVGEAGAIAYEEKLSAMAEDYGTVTLAYEMYLTTVQTEVLASAASSDWAGRMNQGGWMRAGVWFFETSRLQGFVQTLMTALSTSSSETADEFNCGFTLNFTNCKEQKAEYKSFYRGFKLIAGRAEQSQTTAKSTVSTSNLDLTTSKAVNGEAVKTLDEGMFAHISKAVSSVFLDTIMDWGSDNATGLAGGDGGGFSSNTSSMISPFTAVSSLGRGLQQITVVIWTAGFVASGLLGAAGGTWGAIGDGLSGGVLSAAAGALKYLMATIVPVISGIGALAFMLAFAIPFMPVTVWIMLVCGYLVTVIEAIAAAPLAVIMLATPEGEGIAGSSFKQALQMINAIILRPSLSIVGLFAAMTLSYVGFAILNDLFWSVAGLTTSAGLFEILALVFIYSTLAFKVCEYMVQVIHKIPDQIMQWMGGGMQREFGESAVGGDMVGALKSNAAIAGVSGMAGMQTAGKIVKGRMDNNVKSKADKAAKAEEAAKAAGG